MVGGVVSIYSRIRSIYERISEIQRSIGNIYSSLSIGGVQKSHPYEVNSRALSPQVTKTFQEVLREAMLENAEPKVGNMINVLSKPGESWREVLETYRDDATVGEVGSSEVEKEDKFDRIIEMASSKYGVPKELIKSVIKAESNFNPVAISPKNAMGLMQLIPSTAEEMGVDDVFDPFQNIMGGTRYLKMLLDRYNGNLFLALAAYNAGPKQVDAVGRIPNIEETKNYVDRVIRFYKEYSSR